MCKNIKDKACNSFSSEILLSQICSALFTHWHIQAQAHFSMPVATNKQHFHQTNLYLYKHTNTFTKLNFSWLRGTSLLNHKCYSPGNILKSSWLCSSFLKHLHMHPTNWVHFWFVQSLIPCMAAIYLGTQDACVSAGFGFIFNCNSPTHSPPLIVTAMGVTAESPCCGRRSHTVAPLPPWCPGLPPGWGRGGPWWSQSWWSSCPCDCDWWAVQGGQTQQWHPHCANAGHCDYRPFFNLSEFLVIMHYVNHI